MSKVLNKVTGAVGEKLAVKYLRKNKYKILEINYTNKIGEIDIIARQKDILIFVEVKNRSSVRFGLPGEAVTTKKQHKIRLVATSYLKIKKQLNSKCRFDVIEVLDGQVNHIIEAF